MGELPMPNKKDEAVELAMWRKRARKETKIKSKVVSFMTLADLKAAVAAANGLVGNPVPDHEGVDEWVLSIFDSNGSHVDPLYDGIATFRECSRECAEFRC